MDVQKPAVESPSYIDLLWTDSDPASWERLGIELPGAIDALETIPSDGPEREALILVFGDSKLRIVSSDGARSRSIPMSSGFFSVPISRWIGTDKRADSASVFRRLGSLEKLTLGSEWSEVESKWSIDLPLVVDRSWGGLDLETPQVVKLSIDENGTHRYLVGPQAYGLQRLRTMFVELEGDQSPSTFEVWSMFLGPETVEESWYVVFNGKPALLVTSVQADKHGVFEKKKIRLFFFRKGSESIRLATGAGGHNEIPKLVFDLRRYCRCQ